MTVPVQRGSMAILQPPRSRFMINDILGGAQQNAPSNGHHMHHHHLTHQQLSSLHHHITDTSSSNGRDGSEDDARSPSPQQPRDLTLPPNSNGNRSHLPLLGHHHLALNHAANLHNHHLNGEDSDSDSSGQDNHSVCSNGKVTQLKLLDSSKVMHKAFKVNIKNWSSS